MINNLDEKAKAMLVKDEGVARYPYACSGGALSIGIGHNLEGSPLPEPIIVLLFQHDLDQAKIDAERIYGKDFFDSISENRKLALLNLCFNLGFNKLSQFWTTNDFIKEQRWNEAADQILTTKWAHQVKSRAYRIADMLRHDSFPY